MNRISFKKSFIILILILLGCSATFAQVKFGLRAGISSSSLNSSDIVQDNYEYRTLSDVKVGFHAGLFSQIRISGMYIQPEFLLSSTGGEVQIRDLTSGQAKVQDQRFTKLDIPVMVGWRFGPLRLGAGPIASILLSKPADAIDFSGTSVKRKFNSATFGYQLDLGLDLGNFAVDVKREGNLTRLGNGVVIGGEERKFDSRNSQWLLSVGLFF